MERISQVRDYIRETDSPDPITSAMTISTPVANRVRLLQRAAASDSAPARKKGEGSKKTPAAPSKPPPMCGPRKRAPQPYDVDDYPIEDLDVDSFRIKGGKVKEIVPDIEHFVDDRSVLHWKEDGDVEIRTDDGKRFRIDSGMLRQASAVFRDMIQIGDTSNSNSNSKGKTKTPSPSPSLITLSESGPLISTFLDTLHLSEPIPDLPTARQLLLLADKYEITTHIRMHVILLCYRLLETDPLGAYDLGYQVKDQGSVVAALKAMGDASPMIGKPAKMEWERADEMGFRAYFALVQAYEAACARYGQNWNSVHKFIKMPS